MLVNATCINDSESGHEMHQFTDDWNASDDIRRVVRISDTDSLLI